MRHCPCSPCGGLRRCFRGDHSASCDYLICLLARVHSHSATDGCTMDWSDLVLPPASPTVSFENCRADRRPLIYPFHLLIFCSEMSQPRRQTKLQFGLRALLWSVSVLSICLALITDGQLAMLLYLACIPVWIWICIHVMMGSVVVTSNLLDVYQRRH